MFLGKKVGLFEERESNFNGIDEEVGVDVEIKATKISVELEAKMEEKNRRNRHWIGLLEIAENLLSEKKEEEIRSRKRRASREAELVLSCTHGRRLGRRLADGMVRWRRQWWCDRRGGGQWRCRKSTGTQFSVWWRNCLGITKTNEGPHLRKKFQKSIPNLGWDLEAMDLLPEYVQMCFLTLNNFINEMAYDVLKEQGVLIIQHLRKSWTDLCTTVIQEAQWHAAGYTPTLNEYLSNGWISSSVPVNLSHAFFLITNPMQNEAVRSLYKYHDVVRYARIGSMLHEGNWSM